MPKTFNIRIEETVAEDFTIKADSSKAAVLKVLKTKYLIITFRIG